MKHLKLLEEVNRTPWAMLIPSFRAMLGAFDGTLSEDDYSKFHSLERETSRDVFGREIDGLHYATVNNNVGFLMVDGPITPRATYFSDVSGMTSLDVLTSDFQALEKNPSIDTIVMLFDSPGGAAKGLSDFNSVVRSAKTKTISFSWMAASAAYWMASAADKVIVTQDGMVGSVGVVATIRDYKAADEKRGIRNIEIVSTQSPKKRPDPTTPEGRDQIQEMVDGMADVFIQSVADNFGITKKFVQSNFGGGAMVLAGKALEAGMVDKIQTADELVKSIVKSNSIYSIQTISADSADSTPNMEDQTMNVEKLKKEHADVHAEIAKTVQAEEVERLRAIEAIKKDFADSPEFVREAAVNAVDDHKFDEGATVESVQGHVIKAIAGARNQEVKNNVQAIHDHAAPRREAAKIAEQVSEAAPVEPSPVDPEAADKSQIERMLAASKAEGRIK
jgi:ClpP class serine protease